MRISDWSSDVCSSDLQALGRQDAEVDADRDEGLQADRQRHAERAVAGEMAAHADAAVADPERAPDQQRVQPDHQAHADEAEFLGEHREDEVGVRLGQVRTEEHTSELQSLMLISYAVIVLNNKHSQHIRRSDTITLTKITHNH